MSDHIPFEIQTEIMKRFPVKSLMRFRSVSKPWKSLIDSSGFASDYSLRHTQRYLFIAYKDPHEIDRYVSIVDDDTFPDIFPEKISDMFAILPDSIKQNRATLVGSSQGLLCFCGSFCAIICNPSIGKSKSVEFTTPAVDVIFSERFFGFGICPNTNDPTLVKITFPHTLFEPRIWTIVVFSFKTGSVRSCSFSNLNNLLCKSLELSSLSECVDGFIYWCACNTDDNSWVIISFDMSNQEFGVIQLPDSFTRYKYVELSKHKESLVLIANDYYVADSDYDVWMMEGDDVTKLFKKLFTINSPDNHVADLVFTR
ncbi:F-box/kelch-repeat protein At3g06240-like [Rutidosis leptorrhynchoides]|uniref:F-box/kelch-repeat protein At3g06240-like n=1 Tax=Rutidosis leptorrhynchoides TaxID=125765 RepID=UPI003A99FDFC